MHFYSIVFVFPFPHDFLKETLHPAVNKMDDNSFKDGLWEKTTMFTNIFPRGDVGRW